MPSVSAISSAIAELPNGPPIVAVLTGGTTGIGSYIAEALAATYGKQHGSKLRVYIVGRKPERAEPLIAACRTVSPDSDWRFVQSADLALLGDVDKASAEIARQETEAPFHGGPARVDLLYMSHCYPIFSKRTTTKEGLDAFLSTTYYSRIRFVTQLMPLLTASPRGAAHVVSVYAGGFDHKKCKPGQYLIGCPPDATYGINSVREYTGFMKNFVFEELAARHAGRLSLVHIFPGLVDGPTFTSADMPAWWVWLWRLLIRPLTTWMRTPPDVCGKVMLYLSTDHFPAKDQKVSEGVEVASGNTGEVGGGAYSVGKWADPTNEPGTQMFAAAREEGVSKKCWDHTMEVLGRIEKENAKAAP